MLDYGSRRYDPELGRFIQPDSIGPLASQRVQAYDRCCYENNNPVRYNDLLGHCIEDLCIGESLLLALVVKEAAPEIEAFAAEEGPIIAGEATALEEAKDAFTSADSYWIKRR